MRLKKKKFLICTYIGSLFLIFGHISCAPKLPQENTQAHQNNTKNTPFSKNKKLWKITTPLIQTQNSRQSLSQITTETSFFTQDKIVFPNSKKELNNVWVTTKIHCFFNNKSYLFNSRFFEPTSISLLSLFSKEAFFFSVPQKENKKDCNIEILFVNKENQKKRVLIPQITISESSQAQIQIFHKKKPFSFPLIHKENLNDYFFIKTSRDSKVHLVCENFQSHYTYLKPGSPKESSFLGFFTREVKNVFDNPNENYLQTCRLFELKNKYLLSFSDYFKIQTKPAPIRVLTKTTPIQRAFVTQIKDLKHSEFNIFNTEIYNEGSVTAYFSIPKETFPNIQLYVGHGNSYGPGKFRSRKGFINFSQVKEQDQRYLLSLAPHQKAMIKTFVLIDQKCFLKSTTPRQEVIIQHYAVEKVPYHNSILYQHLSERFEPGLQNLSFDIFPNHIFMSGYSPKSAIYSIVNTLPNRSSPAKYYCENN